MLITVITSKLPENLFDHRSMIEGDRKGERSYVLLARLGVEPNTSWLVFHALYRMSYIAYFTVMTFKFLSNV